MEKKEYLDLYHQMVLIRRVEERSAELYQQGKIGGFFTLIHRSGSGQHWISRCQKTTGPGHNGIPRPRTGN
jgi:hypothetical protein